ncbi:MAG: hypothetical protein AAF389_15020 [Gemmatimonadota bacterium]
MIGLWIDGLTPEQRDRIIEGQGWTTSESHYVDPDGCRCLVGHVDGWQNDDEVPDVDSDEDAIWGLDGRPNFIACRYPDLVKRFGVDRVVRVIKQRAAKGNRVFEDSPAGQEAVS